MSARNTTPAFAVGGVGEPGFREMPERPMDHVGLDRDGICIGYVGGGNTLGFINMLCQKWQSRYPGGQVILLPCGEGRDRWRDDTPKRIARYGL